MAVHTLLNTTLMLAAAVSSLVLAGLILSRSPRRPAQWSFALGMLGFAAESLAAFMLVEMAEVPADRLFWLRAVQVAGLVLPLPWGFFVADLAYPKGTRLPPGWRLGLVGGSVLALVGSVAVASLPAFEISGTPGPFYAARFELAGRYGVIVQLLATVAILGGLELCLRTSKGVSRWRIKYLVLGLGGIFLVRFYLLSNVLLFHVLMAVYLKTEAATLLIGTLVIGASLARDRLQGVQLTVSRHILYRSVVVGVLGLYLFVVGALGWLLGHLGIAEELFWGSLAVFVSALGLAVILFSENVRWRIKRFIGLHFYRAKYDYRDQWTRFTKRLSSLISIEELAPELLGAVIEAVGAAEGMLYLTDDREGHLQPAASTAKGPPSPPLILREALKAKLIRQRTPFTLGNGQAGGEKGTDGVEQEMATLLPGREVSVIVPLVWRDSLAGLLVIGPERTGAPYTLEDLDLLATVGEQAAGAIATAQLSEKLAQGREFEAFHRLTSFVIHDLKNSISALSMLSQNALDHFDDPEFQRDALKTLSQAVDRMRALLARLSSAPKAQDLSTRPVDLAALVRETIETIKAGKQVTLVRDLQPVPLVQGDPEALQRLIQNLVTNALEALNGEGEVTVKTYQESEWVALSVSDTGCGIPEEFLRKSLFTPFRSTKSGGWGIGLFQAKGVVEAHGGTIEVESKVGKGTTFSIKLPSGAVPSRWISPSPLPLPLEGGEDLR